MEIRQKTEMRRLLVPALRQSLKILTLPLPDLKALIEQELENNPLLEEASSVSEPEKLGEYLDVPPLAKNNTVGPDSDFRLSQLTKKVSLQDILLRQLGMFADTDEVLRIGQEIIGNIDDEGYLKATLEELSASLNVQPREIEDVLKLIQQFEPAGVGARTISECLLIQLKSSDGKDPLLWKIVESYLEDVAKKNYSRIAKALKEPLEKIELLIKKIAKLNPKPGRDYSTEQAIYIVPDISIDEQGEELKVTINNEQIPTLNINRTYVDMLKKGNLDQATKEFLSEKLNNAMELFRAITKRQHTLRKVIDVIVEFQQEAIKGGFNYLKPLKFKEVAEKLNMHETTICRVVMNKYVKTPWGVVSLKNFFSSHIHDDEGKAISSKFVKGLINEFIEQEDRKHPFSDEDIVRHLRKNHALKLARRTVTKYREELKILSSTFRRER